MNELGVDMSEEFPKPLTDEVVRAADVVITMGCGDACPIYPGKKYEDWELDDPAGQDLDDGAPDPRRDRRRGRSADRRTPPLARVDTQPLARRARSPRRSAPSRSSSPARGAIMVDAKTDQLGHVGVAITFGLVIMAMIYAVGHVSGAHFNAAVTFAFALTPPLPLAARRSPTGRRSSLGALAAAALLRGSLGNIAHVGATLPSGSQAQSFLWELVMSVFLMFVILAVATDTRAVGEAAAIAIGGTIGLDAMFGGPISGASMNPMRSLGPALVSGDLHALWLYILAPILGASLGGLAYQFVRGEQPGIA